MHPALLQLTRLRVKATLRRMIRVMRTPRGVVFTILGGLLFTMWFVPVILSSTVRRTETFDPQTALTIGPAVLLLLCLVNIISRMGRGALYFTPPEIDFLFPAPVSRLHLLLYKMIGLVAASAGVSIFATIFLAGASRWFGAGLIATFLAMLFINLVSVAAALVKESVVQSGTAKLRAAVVIIATGVVAAFALPLGSLPPDLEFTQAVQFVLQSPSVMAVLAPFAVFVRVLVATDLAALGLWTSAGLLMNLLIFAAIVRLDSLNLEAAMHSSRRQHDRMQRVARGGPATTWKNAARWRLPLLPPMNGVGAIVWRQLTTAIRTSKGLLFVLALILIAVAGVSTSIDPEKQHIALAALTGPGVFFTFFLITMTRFDFRNDLDQLEWLKMLPITPRALVIGQLLSPVLVLTLVQWIVLAVLAVAFGYGSIMLIAAAFVVPLNVVLVGIENALFLMYPTRQLAAGVGDLQAVGRNMVLFLVRGFVVVAWAGLGAGLGAIVLFLAESSMTTALVIAWIVLAATSLLVIPVTSWAFRRFDVSVHMPA